jgi:hypothetical protein
LALALAQNHVPGFQEKLSRSRGRHADWNEIEEFTIWRRFLFAKAKGLSERSAAAYIAKTLDKGFPTIRPVPKTSAMALLRRLKRIESRMKNMKLIS